MRADKKNCTVWISIAAALVFAACFMPWGVIDAKPVLTFSSPGDAFFGPDPFGNETITLTITGWNGHVTVAGVKLPNWTTLVVALAVAALAWLTATDAWHAPRLLVPILALMGLIQALITAGILAAADEGSVGIGVLLVAACFGVMLVASIVLAMQPLPAGHAAHAV